MINAIIPARAGSKRITSKNTVLLGRHPLLAYSIIACKLTSNINRVIVSTECKNIANIALKYGAEVPFLRPEKYATDQATDYGFLKQAFDYLKCEYLALIRPTSPFRNPSVLDETIVNFSKNIVKDKTLTGLRTMCESNHSPYKMFKVDDNICSGFFENYNGIKNYTSLPNQIFPKSYLPNGYIDIVYRKTIESNKIFGDKIYSQISSPIIDIDEQFDLDIASALVGTKYDLLSVHLNKL